MHWQMPLTSGIKHVAQMGLLGTLLCSVVLGALPVATYAQANLSPDKAQVLSELKQRTYSLQAKRRAIQAKRNEKLRQVNRKTSEIVENQQRLHGAERNKSFQQSRLVVVEKSIGSLGSQIDRTIGETTRLSQAIGKRLVAIYSGDRVSVLQMILESNNMATFLDRVYYKKKLLEADKDLLTNYRNRLEQLHQQKAQLNYEESARRQAIQSIQSLQGEIQGRIQRDKALRSKYAQDAQTYEAMEQDLLAESNRLRSEIQGLIAAQSHRKTPVQGSTGSMMWPVKGKLTSNYGYRRHPIHGTYKMHTGIDISAPSGTPVRAADGGEIIAVGWRGGYGKMIVVMHGNRHGSSVTTLYGHLSGFAVSKGQSVGKGQVIGYVGSTGYSTGPHLHFEVRLNGQTVNPRGYL